MRLAIRRPGRTPLPAAVNEFVIALLTYFPGDAHRAFSRRYALFGSGAIEEFLKRRARFLRALSMLIRESNVFAEALRAMACLRFFVPAAIS